MKYEVLLSEMGRSLGILAATSSGSCFTGSIAASVMSMSCIVVFLVALCATHKRKRDGTNKVRHRDSDLDDSLQRSSPGKEKLQNASPTSRYICMMGGKLDEVDADGATSVDLMAYEQEYKLQQLQEEDAVWQRTILMGEKCEPPSFSGQILYDEFGNRVSEYPPRSPRSLPGTFEP
ncbi:hypothetical protein O6H91_13G021900 [Diphasiastrum complanatum]|uniref:Uncharacterized protein n=1 Tax=Diphasiastrum complanatum TaxID=34168 RepID=A0ACC2BTS5_DIPCM|nr:hypothetical protein O6H91_13G021900 [Diphasiastrum complanatum]